MQILVQFLTKPPKINEQNRMLPFKSQMYLLKQHLTKDTNIKISKKNSYKQ